MADSLASTLNSTTSGSASAANAALTNLSKSLAALQKQQSQERVGEVQDFQKETRDVGVDNNITARDIGRLRLNSSRLNLFSTLSKKDFVDVYTFHVDTASETFLGQRGNSAESVKDLRVQVFSKQTGRLIADSDPKAGGAYDAYQKLQEGTFQMQRGDYALRLSRMPGADSGLNKEYNYVVQLSQGTHKQDYDTIEKAYRPGTDNVFGLTGGLDAGTSNLVSALSTSYSFINSLPKIGSTSGTDKMFGVLYNAMF